jgi:hypothetical protein
MHVLAGMTMLTQYMNALIYIYGGRSSSHLISVAMHRATVEDGIDRNTKSVSVVRHFRASGCGWGEELRHAVPPLDQRDKFEPNIVIQNCEKFSVFSALCQEKELEFSVWTNCCNIL